MTWLLTGNSETDPSQHFLGTSDQKPLRVKTNGVERMTVTETGNVGIGANAPSATLTVETGEPDNEPWGTAAFHRQGVGNNWSHIHWGRTGDWYIRSASDTGKVILQDTKGIVGIGTSTPDSDYKLDVSGGVRATFLHVSNTVEATEVFLTSDARLKTDVRRLTGVLEKVVHIRGVSFDWNELGQSRSCSSGRRQIGILAQELEAIYPELVSNTGAKNYRAIDYARLSAVLVEAIKELKSDTDVRFAALESEIATQREEIARLRAEQESVTMESPQMRHSSAAI